MIAASSLPGAAAGAVSSSAAGLIDLPGRDLQFRQAADGFRLGRVLGENRGIDRGRAFGVALGRGFLGLGQKRRRAAGKRADDALDESADLAFRKRADEAVDRLATVEGDDRRNRLDAELAGDLRVLVDVHLDEGDLAVRIRHRLFERRRELFARAAPRRPEIHQHRLLREAVSTSARNDAAVTSLTAVFGAGAIAPSIFAMDNSFSAARR